MSNVSRHRPGDTLEWFYSEWHGEHVDIMRRSPGVMRLVRRYVQNRALHDDTLPPTPLPLGPEGWDAMSQLTFDGIDEFIGCFKDPDYIANVRGHLLSDPETVVTVLTEDEPVFDSDLPETAVKAVLFYQLQKPGAFAEFERVWVGEYAQELTSRTAVVKHVRNRLAGSVNDDVFQNTRWQDVVINQFQAYDELWFADRTGLADFLAAGRAAGAIDLLARFLTERSFTYLCREIVQIDSSTTSNA